MKRTPLMRAAALLVSLALVLGFAGSALAAAKEPIAVSGNDVLPALL